MDVLTRCIEACRREPGTVVLPDCLDDRVIEAAAQLKAEKLLQPILVQSAFAVRDRIRRAAVRDMGIVVVDPSSRELLERNMTDYMELREAKGKPVTEEQAENSMRCPLAASAMMVRRKEADVGVAGNISSTADVLRAGLAILPRKQGIKTISSFFFMISPDSQHQFVFADCAVVPEPSPEAMADIAIASAEKARNLLQEEPRVALLSFSSKGSAKHHRAEAVREALALVHEKAPDLMIDGELQFDAAFVPRVAALKAPGSVIEGQANVFVFPSLEAGNIAYKMVQRLGGYTAMGPFLQGFDGGWHDLSRGCSAKDVYKVAVLGLCMQRGNLLN